MCEPLKVLCVLGPDASGSFVSDEMSINYARSCDKRFCTCAIEEDFLEKVEDHLAQVSPLVSQN